MATQTVSTPGPGPHPHRQQSSTTMPYPPLPASPTLTNPDMILPDYDDADLASSPERSQSPLLMWKNAHASVVDMQFHMAQQNGFPAGPITPTTPIIYGNGTMLSDIGEVTEVESTIGKDSRPCSRLSNDSDNDTGFRSSPTMGPFEAISKKTKVERRVSVGSTSTIRTQDQAGLFADFDDAVSVDDSNFQGDDEESVADSFVDDASVQETHPRNQGNESGLNDGKYSTASISRRAEQILANAKRRLTNMEGNLTRARSSLYITSTGEFGSGDSTPSPPMVRASSSHEKMNGHGRMPSDDSSNNDSRPNGYPRRAASALGAAGGYRQPLTSSKSHDTLNGGPIRYKISQHGGETALETLSEDEPSLGLQSNGDSGQNNQFLSPTFGSDTGQARSSSAMQMRDLKDQMKDLKGKISSLREQARADSLKRRSLQSLRTPSPFTHAQVDQWYETPDQIRGAESGNAVPGRNPWNGELSSVDGDDREKQSTGTVTPVPREDEESVISAYEDVEEDRGRLMAPEAEPVKVAEVARPEGVDMDDMHTEDGYQDEEAVEDYNSESGESLYHDTFSTPVSHEDREDAFDYEHFFLHSAMGTISQQRLRSGSFSSEGSVETTRGPIASTEDAKNQEVKPRQRRGSGDTTSTMESFATADEGRSHRSGSGSPKPQDGVVTTNGELRTRRSTIEPISEDDTPGQERHNSVIRRPFSTSAAHTALHRPSVSSFESTGTNRSFPLVNKAKLAAGVLTPQGSPDQELKQIADSLMSETASIMESESGDAANPATMQTLEKEDQILVERLVASLGRCVLGLSEAGRATTEARMYRRRIDAARRLLEGEDSSF